MLNPTIFERMKTYDIIRKNKKADMDIAILNSSLNPYHVAFENATDEMVKNNLIFIQNILVGKLLQESFKK